MDKIIGFMKELIEGGFIGQAVIASMLVGGYIYMSVAGATISVEYAALTSAVVAWYFRGAAQNQSAREEVRRLRP